MTKAAFGRALLVAILLGVGIACARCGRPDSRAACPRGFAQTGLAAALLWDQLGHAWPPPGSGATPEDLVLLADPGDSDACARLAAAIPDTLEFGLGAPFFTAFYQVADVYVVPVVPRVTRAEIEAESRGETILWKEGVTFVFDRDFELRYSARN